MVDRPSLREMLDLQIREAAFQATIIQLAQYHGWRTYHTHDSRHSAGGFPDLVLVRSPRLIFAELKTEKGKVSEEQMKWLNELEGTSTEVYLWRPSNWDEIQEVLCRSAGQHPIGTNS